MIQDAINNYLYDAKGRLCAVEVLQTTAAMEYVYDADGNRVAKGNWSGITWPTAGHTWAANAIPSCATPTAANGFTLTAVYLRGASGTQDVEIDPAQGSSPAGWHQNVFAGGGLLATYTQSGTASPALYFDFNDWLGTKRLVVNAAGQAVNYWGSDPFGDYLTPHVTTDPSELHFTGKERDAESGNDYFGARYYGSNMGRFMSPDWSAKVMPIPYAKLGNPQSLNLYSYVLNNPLSNVDPDGHCCWDWLVDKIQKIGNWASDEGWKNNAEVQAQKANSKASVSVSSSYELSAGAMAALGALSFEAASQQGLDQATQGLQQGQSSSSNSDDVMFTHFTDAEGLQGITGLDPMSLSPGETTTVNELNFGTGSNSYLAGQAGDNFVTDMPASASSPRLSQVGIFGNKQSFAITYSGTQAASQGVMTRGTGQPNIYTIPANSSFTGCFIITCR